MKKPYSPLILSGTGRGAVGNVIGSAAINGAGSTLSYGIEQIASNDCTFDNLDYKEFVEEGAYGAIGGAAGAGAAKGTSKLIKSSGFVPKTKLEIGLDEYVKTKHSAGASNAASIAARKINEKINREK